MSVSPNVASVGQMSFEQMTFEQMTFEQTTFSPLALFNAPHFCNSRQFRKL